MPEALNIQQLNKTEKKEHLVLHRDSLAARFFVGVKRFSVVVQSVLGFSVVVVFLQCERLRVHLPQSFF